MVNKIFDIAFKNNDRQYKGWVNPDDETTSDGHPVSFHVVLDGTSFGHLSFNNCKWTVNEQRPAELVEAVGKEIEKKYRL